MKPQITLSIVIPVYNEGAGILETVRAVQALIKTQGIHGEVIVVDDGSTDDTPKYVAESGARVVTHPKNRGYGAALKSGIRHALFEWIAIIDADLTYPVEELPKLLARASGFDMVVGARQGRFYHGSPIKRALRIFFKFLVEFATGQKITDINSGYRVFKKSDVTEYFDFISNGFSFTTSITLLYCLNNKWVDYVPVSYHKRAGKSHVKLIRDGLRAFQFIVTAMLTYNPIKAFLLLLVTYGIGVLGLILGQILAPNWPFFTLVLAWTGASILVGLGFLAITVQMTNFTSKSRPH